MVYDREPRKKYYKRDKSDNTINVELIKLFLAEDTPICLYGVNLRNIIASSEWVSYVKNIYKRANSRCELCGKYCDRDKDESLNLFDYYSFDSEKSEFKFVDYYALCDDCYSTIRPKEDMSETLRSRLHIRRQVYLNLIGVLYTPSQVSKKGIYYMYYDGHKYINDLFPDIAHYAYTKGLRVIHCGNDRNFKLHPDEYYHKPYD